MMIKKLVVGVGIVGGFGASGCALQASLETDEKARQEVSVEAGAVSSGSAGANDTCGPWKRALIDDLEDGDVFFGPNDQGAWLVFNDETGEQVPVIAHDLVARGGPRGSRFAAHSTGTGFTTWGAGFGLALGCGYDVRKYDGVSFKVKGGGRRAFATELVTLALLPEEYGGRCTGDGCNDYHRASITLPEDRFYECVVPFESLAQQGFGTPTALDLATVSGIQFNVAPAEMPYDLWVDDVRFAKGARSGCTPIHSACR